MDTCQKFNLMLNKAIESFPLAFKDFDKTKNIQSQLQAILTIEAQIKLTEHKVHSREAITAFKTGELSWEIIWLGLVMLENHGQVWTEKKWEDKPSDVQRETFPGIMPPEECCIGSIGLNGD